MGATDDRIEVRLSPVAAAGRAQGARPTQQDDLICLHDDAGSTHLLVLADGMGGHGAGELASRLVLDVAAQLWAEGGWKEEAGPLFLERLCQRAHQRLRDHHGADDASPHSTIVCLLIKPAFSYWAHVGDSRLYRYEGRRFLGCTEDHSVTRQKLHRGELAAGEVDAQQHLLLQGLGGRAVPVVEHGGMPSRDDHRFVLCSDGVWAHVSSEELGQLVRSDAREAAIVEALNLALKRGGEQADNASLIFVRPDPAGARGLARWLPLLRHRR
jgi:PPM family protein phosphatase